MEIYEKIRYYREHTDYSQRNVAKILGVSRNTVKKYWEGQTVPWERKPGSGRKNDIITDEVKSFIIKCIESDKKAPRKQNHTAHKIYERLVAECGFEGCEASVRRTVAELRCNIHDIFVPLSYEPAEAVQVDWGEVTIILGGCKQKIQIWCMRECYSGDIFVTAFYRQNEESFLEGIVKGLEHFGGTPQKIIFDNARVAVKEGFGHHAKAAKFPSLKTLDEFDMTRLENVSESTIRQLASCDFIKQRQNIVMIGNPGSGKTHLSIALGMNACEAGYRVKFYTAVNLAAELAEAVQMNRLSRLEKNLSKIDLLIIDELSYLTFNRYQSEMLFQIISERSEQASVIISTNLEFSEWTQLFENEMMLAALIDRVTFRSFVLNMNCSSSYRIDSTMNND